MAAAPELDGRRAANIDERETHERPRIEIGASHVPLLYVFAARTGSRNVQENDHPALDPRGQRKHRTDTRPSAAHAPDTVPAWHPADKYVPLECKHGTGI